ncbi:iron ABC transporter permease [Candidatus Sumerlaeota bacterium]|nr:iron ABC transporter permease [Candidatus Sumerlaeota bacterium]
MKERRGACVVWTALGTALLLASIVCPLLGATKLSLAQVMAGNTADAQIFLTARLPRVLFAIVAGAGLAVAGAVYQALLRNDLADPYTLGVSGGASFGALLMLHLMPAAALFFALPLASFAGAAAAVGIVYTLSQARRRRVDPAKLLLAGITLNLLFSSGILLIQYLSDPYQTFSMVRWMMGGVDVSTVRIPGMVALFVVPCLMVVLAQGKRLNLLTLGDMTAAHLGVDVRRTKPTLLAAASIMAAAIVAYAGPIGFIGLLVPHITRRLVGADHRLLLVPCAMAGGLLLLVCDTLARSLPPLIPTMPGSELPVGIVTAFMGAPFFLLLLLRGKSGRGD